MVASFSAIFLLISCTSGRSEMSILSGSSDNCFSSSLIRSIASPCFFSYSSTSFLLSSMYFFLSLTAWLAFSPSATINSSLCFFVSSKFERMFSSSGSSLWQVGQMYLSSSICSLFTDFHNSCFSFNLCSSNGSSFSVSDFILDLTPDSYASYIL